jgi:hypothetical protein
LIAHYNDTALPRSPDRLGLLIRTLLTKRIKMQGFIIFDDYGHLYGEFYQKMSAWLAEDRIKYREDIVERPRPLSDCLKARTSANWSCTSHKTEPTLNQASAASLCPVIDSTQGETDGHNRRTT